MEHIVLEYDENTRTALVVATSGGREPVLSGHASPYIVADGYDFESRSWGAGHYFTDIAEAKIDYEHSCRHPYPLAGSSSSSTMMPPMVSQPSSMERSWKLSCAMSCPIAVSMFFSVAGMG